MIIHRHALYLLLQLVFISCATNRVIKEGFQMYRGLESREGLHYLKGENKPFTGSTESNYGNGVPFVQAGFKNGKLHGTYKAYYSIGQQMGESNYKIGIKDGISIGWHENGKKASELHFKEGRKRGN